MLVRIHLRAGTGSHVGPHARSFQASSLRFDGNWVIVTELDADKYYFNRDDVYEIFEKAVEVENVLG